MAIHRTDSNYNEVVRDIAADLLQLMKLDDKARAGISVAAMATAARADWSQFIKYYNEAYQIALDNHSK